MFCHKCGEEIQPDDTKFCPSCGTSISNSVVKPTPSSNYNDESDSVKSERSLSDEVRQKYISELCKYKESLLGWVGVLVLLALMSLFGTDWYLLVDFIFLMLIGYTFYEDAKRKLQNHGDEMLELLYNEMKIKRTFKNIAIGVAIGICLFIIIYDKIVSGTA